MFIRPFVMMFVGVFGSPWAGPIAIGISLGVLTVTLIWAAVPWLLAASLGVGWMTIWLIPTSAAIFGVIRWRNYASQYG